MPAESGDRFLDHASDLAREALDVDTTAQAVLKASFQNQIFVVPA